MSEEQVWCVVAGRSVSFVRLSQFQHLETNKVERGHWTAPPTHWSVGLHVGSRFVTLVQCKNEVDATEFHTLFQDFARTGDPTSLKTQGLHVFMVPPEVPTSLQPVPLDERFVKTPFG